MAEVDNPMHVYLVQLKRQMESVRPALRNGLDRPTRNMAGGKVWTSAAATAFARALDANDAKTKKAVDRAYEDLTDRLARTPEKVSPEEADKIRRRYGL
ncbi:hypothetical protein GCM10022224_023810 [Nonomuraea antimicrobica]|uniref:Excreted virulence factor EspC, type VII ESX diderm n=1 Tax=Nonomuraea antimicrobica TaxID=561173 RepID=A0ABP7BFV6_9ACTN